MAIDPSILALLEKADELKAACYSEERPPYDRLAELRRLTDAAIDAAPGFAEAIRDVGRMVRAMYDEDCDGSAVNRATEGLERLACPAPPMREDWEDLFADDPAQEALPDGRNIQEIFFGGLPKDNDQIVAAVALLHEPRDSGRKREEVVATRLNCDKRRAKSLLSSLDRRFQEGKVVKFWHKEAQAEAPV